MAQPTYILNRERFDLLCRSHNLTTASAFIARTGMPRRTFYDVLDAKTDIKGATIAYFLDAFPLATFEDLFTRTPVVAAADVRPRSLVTGQAVA